MSSDFADMLKDTLVSMQDRIEFANQDYPDETNKEIEGKFQQVQEMNKQSWDLFIYNLLWTIMNNLWAPFFITLGKYTNIHSYRLTSFIYSNYLNLTNVTDIYFSRVAREQKYKIKNHFYYSIYFN